MSNKVNILRQLIGIVAILTLPVFGSGQAIVGGEINYRCIGGDQFEVNLTIRKDCSADGSASFDNAAAVGIFDIFGALILGLEDKGVAYVPLVEQNNVLNDIIFNCDTPLEELCVEEGIYRDTITLPYNKLGYIISYQRCCRNGQLDNIENPSTTGATYSSLINYIALGECNSQPQFNNWPGVELCLDSELNFDHSAVDADGDQLVYRLCTPSKGASVTRPKPEPPANPPYEDIVFASGFSESDPLGAGNNFSINPNTGVITANGNVEGTYLVGICVDEYRNGSLLSTVKRDFELNVTSCTDPLTADFEVDNPGCDGDNTITITNNSVGADDYLWYFDYPNTDPAFTSTDENPVFVYPESGTYTIRLESTRDSDGCTVVSEQVIMISSGTVSADFTVDYESCEGGVIILTDNSSDPNGIGIPSSWEWVVISAGDTLLIFGDSVTVDAPANELVEVTLTVTSSDGCSDTISDSFINNFGQDLLISPTVVDCEEDIVISLTDTQSEMGGVSIVSQTWTVDGVVSTGNSVSFTVDEDGVEVSYEVVFENGCILTFSDTYFQEDFRSEVDFTAEILECTGDSATVIFTGISDSTFTIVSEVWLVNGNSFEVNPLTITLPTDEVIELMYEVTYDNGCVSRITANSTLLPDMSIIDDQSGCPDVDSLLVTFEPDIFGGIIDVAPTEYTWTYDFGTGAQTFVGRELVLMIRQMDTVQINLVVTLDNGCELEDDTEFSLGEMEDLTIESDLNCDDPLNPTVTLTDITMLPAGVTVIGYTWTVDGQVITDPSVEFIILEGGSTVTLIVEYSNGCIGEYEQTFEYTQEEDIEIAVTSIDTCTGEIDLYVVNPDSSLLYEWSTDGDFVNIIGEGDTLVYDLPQYFDGFVYVQGSAEGDQCRYGVDSIQITDQAIDLSFDDDFEICAGDTTTYSVINNNPDHIITYEWKAGDELISGGDGPDPVIGIGLDQDSSFQLILCATNQFGCTSVDTIDIDISENEDLDPFDFEIDTCGSLTVNFMANNEFNGTPTWDFGDGTSSNEENPSHTYPQTGTYIVTLSDSSLVCPKNSVMDTVVVPELPSLTIDVDTINFVLGDTVTIVATTNGNQDSIQWCDTDGELIFTGNPLVYVPMDSCETITAKITDEFGCEASDMVVLKEEDDCREFEIEGPDTVCKGEEFMLEITSECPLGEYTYLWDPEDCIVSGGDTPNPTVTTTESKTFSVLITSIETGLDTVLTFDVEVSMPMVEITTENGEDFICLGETGTLLIVPDDPDCEYTWSTGETGNEITVMPEVNTSYTVTCIDIYGCEASDEFTLMVVQPTCTEEDVFLPSAFTPNGDNVNDVLFVRSKFIDIMELKIYNRWGEEVFRSTDPMDGWDGTFEGEPLAPDVFAYSLEVTCINGDEYVALGNVSLLK